METGLAKSEKRKRFRKMHWQKKIGVHGAVIGIYESVEVKPSIKMASQIAEALEVSLDYLAGNTNLIMDNGFVKRIHDIQLPDRENKNHFFTLMDAFLRDYKAKQAYGI
ncbi:MAG: helix-turn-helix transcriptional regulator [Bacteroidales bacterium]|nr:helix-turn-helix transcriptional regulator [Bacteroidales bacterium]MBN2762260.1 helix-turn-helix transcriptional regulator [Bacteroidales bacterium]